MIHFDNKTIARVLLNSRRSDIVKRPYWKLLYICIHRRTQHIITPTTTKKTTTTTRTTATNKKNNVPYNQIVSKQTNNTITQPNKNYTNFERTKGMAERQLLVVKFPFSFFPINSVEVLVVTFVIFIFLLCRFFCALFDVFYWFLCELLFFRWLAHDS